MNPCDDELSAWLALAQVGAKGTQELIEAAAKHGGARPLFSLSDAELQRLDLAPELQRRLRRFDEWDAVAALRRTCERSGDSIAVPGEQTYPRALLTIPDPPLALYYRGTPPSSIEPAVAVVGSRKPTRYGLAVTRGFARELAGAGVTVVSGLARGIDRAAHEGALGAGATAAVVASGLDRVYPREHRALFERIAASSCVLGEFAPGTPPLAHHFPIRNRIITGLCVAVIVVEAARRSGSLISARLAAEQGREVYAVPGNIDSAASAGSNALLRDGAAALTGREDLGALLARLTGGAPPARSSPPARSRPEGEDAGRVFDALAGAEAGVDTLIAATGLDGARILELLTGLEIEGFVARTVAGRYARAGGEF